MTARSSDKTQRPASGTVQRPSTQALWRRVRSMVTPLGWGLALIALVAGLGLALTGWAELLAFVLSSLALIAAGMVMSMGNLGCKAEVDLDRTHLSVGQESELSIILTNPGRRSTRSGRVGILVGPEPSHLPVPALSPGQSVHLHLNLQARHRGAISLGPVTVEAGDPFGVIRRHRVLSAGNQLYVHPRTIGLNPITAGLQRDLEGQTTSGTVDDDMEFHALRPYEPGDDIKRVHWLSTAKTGSMMVRQYEPTLRTDTVLWMDTDPSSYSSAEEFELAVSIFASLGARCLLDGRALAAMIPTNLAGNHTGTDRDRQMSNRRVGLLQNRPVCEADLLRSDTPRAFLDACSLILPVQRPTEGSGRQTSASWLNMMESHIPDASLVLLVSGSHQDQTDIETVSAGLPKSIRSMVLTAAQGEQPTLQQVGTLTRARLGTLEDLPLLLGVLS
nr:DUF58 domain-containing protein [Bifidobacterium indicum]